ncbi:MAG: diphosphate--fructose-6-phosphate 1-phosphotransferase [Planctomycetaceae bacterium]|nr:diphosphate--fructose-6-phosphate 1-phosphotransferase [Planctomycetaceae bacterium]
MLQGNAIIGQSGGPTGVINASLCGIIQACQGQKVIRRTLGMRFGIEGFMQGDVIDLGREKPETIEALRTTPSSALGSCRHKIKDADFPRILEMLKKFDVRYYFLIGGNDTMDTIHRVEAYCRTQGYELIGVGVPKTVDNDLCGTDHTPGFGSAGRYVAMSVKQAGMLARDMKRVDQYVIFQTVGRSAGWLPAAAALAKTAEDDAPHIILLPERPFDRERFLADVKRCHDRYGWCSVVCGEGVTYADGTPVSASSVTDKFSNVEFGAMGGTSAAMMLHQMIKTAYGWRGEFQVCESLQMCAADRVHPGDIEEAYACGRRAVELAANGVSGVMVSIVRESNDPYRWSLGTAPLADVALGAKPMPDAYINGEGNFVTAACLEYLRPLVGPLPEYVRLSGTPA